MTRFTPRPIGQVILQARKLRRVTQAELAARAGVHRSYISDLETGRRLSPSWDIVVALVQAIDLTAEEFLQLLEGERSAGTTPDLDALCREVNRLTPAQQQRVAQFLRLLIECLTNPPGAVPGSGT